MKKILLVEPPFHSFMQYDRWYYPSSLAQLAAIAHQEKHEVYIYDGDKYFKKDPETKKRTEMVKRQHLYYDQVDNLEHEIWKHFKQVLIDYKPDIVGVSIFTCKLKSALNVIKIVYDFDPSIKICVGSAHVTASPGDFISNNNIHGVFTGWADVTFPKWIADGCPKGCFNGIPEKIDIANIPYERRQSLLFPEYYSPKDMGMISVSRGCVGRCSFCSNIFMSGRRIMCRTEESVRMELQELVSKWNVKELTPADSSYTDKTEFYKRIATIYKDFNLPWAGGGRWAGMTEKLMEHFVNCGCYNFCVGLESGSDKILKQMRKGCNRKIIREKAKILNDLGIDWHLFCIIGFPDETADDMKQTLDLALEIAPTHISLNSLSPLPGTEIYKDIPEMTPAFASTVSQLNPLHCFSKHMDISMFREIFNEMTEAFDIYNNQKQDRQHS